MTIAISIKINNGVVLAADSASTILGKNSQGNIAVINVYENANKVFNLYKGLPIGAITWGSGSIGQAAVETLVKDFRHKIHLSEYNFDRETYTIESLAISFCKFIYEDNYLKNYPETSPIKPNLGFMICGYSARKDFAEEYRINIVDGKCEGPQLVRGEDQIGMTWNGEIEAIIRLYYGHSANFPQILKSLGVPDNQISPAMTVIRKKSELPFVVPYMPVQDAIDLAIFLVDTTIKFMRFIPGPPVVAGNIDVAAITKHEGFKWVRRKHYYDIKLNPKEEYPRRMQ